MEPGRCSIHGLIVAEDGRCVICRRGTGEEDAPERTISETTWAVLIGGVVLAGIGAYVLYKDPFHVRSPQSASLGNTQVVAQQQPDEPPPPPPTHHAPVFITDQKPPASAAVPSPPSDGSTDKAALEAAKKQVQIKMYTKPNDNLTAQVRKYFAKHGYTYTELDITQSDTDRIDMTSLNPSGSIPTLVIDGAVVTQIEADEVDGAITRAAQARQAQAQRK